MSKTVVRIVGVIGWLVLIIPFVVGMGCSQQDQSSAPPQQTMPTAPAQPAPMPPSTTAPAPAPQTVAPQTQAPMVMAQNFSQVQLGMTSEQVRQLLGNPTEVEPEGMQVEWKYVTPQGKYQVKFQNDRVVGFKMY